jgi:spermidine/putrescine transport system ATP-binding protein
VNDTIKHEVEDLHLVNLTKTFPNGATAVDDLSLTIPAGSFFALLGPSGCGKTTTLRMVAGLEEPTIGRVFVGDKDMTTEPPYRRPVNTVFQNYALFPNMDIFENVAFGLRRRKVKDVDKQVKAMLDLVELSTLGRRKPTQLSGGQQQRVAVARALINKPDVLLLDEPLGALDLKLRRMMQIELKRIQVEVGTTFVHVTHDQEEAMTMADTIAVMNLGKIEQLGSPIEIYEHPKTAFVANFLGQSNLLRGKTEGNDGDNIIVDIFGSKIALPTANAEGRSGNIVIGVRPEKVKIGSRERAHELPRNQIPGVVTDASFTGLSTQYLVRAPWDQELIVFEQNLSASERFENGSEVLLAWEPRHAFALDADEDLTAGLDEDVLDTIDLVADLAGESA